MLEGKNLKNTNKKIESNYIIDKNKELEFSLSKHLVAQEFNKANYMFELESTAFQSKINSKRKCKSIEEKQFQEKLTNVIHKNIKKIVIKIIFFLYL